MVRTKTLVKKGSAKYIGGLLLMFVGVFLMMTVVLFPLGIILLFIGIGLAATKFDCDKCHSTVTIMQPAKNAKCRTCGTVHILSWNE